jgi:hypothetical protein
LSPTSDFESDASAIPPLPQAPDDYNKYISAIQAKSAFTKLHAGKLLLVMATPSTHKRGIPFGNASQNMLLFNKSLKLYQFNPINLY